jgi:hypothetical protein
LLEEEQPHRILAIDMHVVRDAAGLLSRALDMLNAGPTHVIEAILARQNTAGNQDHCDAPRSPVAVAQERRAAKRAKTVRASSEPRQTNTPTAEPHAALLPQKSSPKRPFCSYVFRLLQFYESDFIYGNLGVPQP